MLSKWESSVLGAYFTLVIVGLFSFTTRLLMVLPSNSDRNQRQSRGLASKPRTGPSHIVVVLGSGGHTAEMVDLMRDFDPRQYTHRTYIISSGDNFSIEKAAEIEDVLQRRVREGSPTNSGESDSSTGIWEIEVVPRARKIHQPLLTTPFSCFWCLVGCFRVLFNASRVSKAHAGKYPDVILANGPATAIIVALAATALRFFAVASSESMKIVYVESFARVKSLSLSGRILLGAGICEAFIVQWEGLAKSLNSSISRTRVQWRGFLVGGPNPIDSRAEYEQ